MGLLMSILHFVQKRFNRKRVDITKHLGPRCNYKPHHKYHHEK